MNIQYFVGFVLSLCVVIYLKWLKTLRLACHTPSFQVVVSTNIAEASITINGIVYGAYSHYLASFGAHIYIMQFN